MLFGPETTNGRLQTGDDKWEIPAPGSDFGAKQALTGRPQTGDHRLAICDTHSLDWGQTVSGYRFWSLEATVSGLQISELADHSLDWEATVWEASLLCLGYRFWSWRSTHPLLEATALEATMSGIQILELADHSLDWEATIWEATVSGLQILELAGQSLDWEATIWEATVWEATVWGTTMSTPPILKLFGHFWEATAWEATLSTPQVLEQPAHLTVLKKRYRGPLNVNVVYGKTHF